MKLRQKVFVSADNRTVVATLITIGDLTDLVVVGLRNETIVLASRLNHDSMQKEIKITELKVLVTNEILCQIETAQSKENATVQCRKMRPAASFHPLPRTKIGNNKILG